MKQFLLILLLFCGTNYIALAGDGYTHTLEGIDNNNILTIDGVIIDDWVVMDSKNSLIIAEDCLIKCGNLIEGVCMQPIIICEESK